MSSVAASLKVGGKNLVKTNNNKKKIVASLHQKDQTVTSSTTIPQEFICPITGSLMIHPLMSLHGHNFEREAILRWIDEDSRNTCPITRKALYRRDLVSNRILQSKIKTWHEEQGIEYPESSLSLSSLAYTTGEGRISYPARILSPDTLFIGQEEKSDNERMRYRNHDKDDSYIDMSSSSSSSFWGEDASLSYYLDNANDQKTYNEEEDDDDEGGNSPALLPNKFSKFIIIDMTPKEFICPLSNNVMQDPVTTKGGYTFEREAIESWIKSQGKFCPISGTELAHRHLTPNKKLKKEIKQWKKERQMDEFGAL